MFEDIHKFTVVLFCLLAIALTGCKPAALKLSGEIRIWSDIPDPALTDYAQKLGTVTLTTVPGSPGWITQLNAAPDSIDLVHTDWSRDVTTGYSAGTLQKIDPFVKKMPALKKLWPGLDTGSASASCIFIPSTVSSWGLFYNKKVLESAGIAVPATWDDFTASLPALRSKGFVPITLGSNFGWPAAGWLSVMDIRLNGASRYRDLLKGKRAFNSKDMNALYALLEDWRNKGFFDPDSGTKNWPDAAADLGNGKGAYLLGRASTWERIPNRGDIGFIAVPEKSSLIQHGELVTIEGYALSGKAKNPEAALALAYAYVQAGAQGQTQNAYQIASMRDEALKQAADQPLKQAQAKSFDSARFLLPQIDRFLSAQSAYDLNQIMIRFFAPHSTMTASDLSAALVQAAPAEARK